MKVIIPVGPLLDLAVSQLATVMDKRDALTICKSLQNSCKEPFCLLADKLGVLVLRVRSSGLQLGVTDGKDITTRLVAQRHVRVAAATGQLQGNI